LPQLSNVCIEIDAFSIFKPGNPRMDSGGERKSKRAEKMARRKRLDFPSPPLSTGSPRMKPGLFTRFRDSKLK